MRMSMGFLSLTAVTAIAAVGCDADVDAVADLRVGYAHAASAESDEASKALPPVANMSVVGYRVSKGFHDDGLVHLTLLPRDGGGAAILDPKLYVEITATSNVPFPMNGQVSLGEVRKPQEKKPFKLGIALDGSGSMESADKEKLRVGATQRLIDAVATAYPGSTFRSDQFDTKVTKLGDFTTDVAAAKSAVTKVGAEGGTALHKSTAELIDAMAALPNEQFQPALLVLSDGMDNASEGVTGEQVVAKAKAANIPIYAVGLGGALDIPGLSFVGDLQGYAEGTGGVFTYVKSANDLASMFDKLAVSTTQGQIFADVKLTGGLFVPFSTITIKVDVHSGSQVASDSFDFIVPID